MNISMLRTRWAAIGAALAVTLGAGGLGISYATSPAGATAYVPITPCRLVDTRTPGTVGPRSTPIGAAETLTVSAHGDNGNCTAANGSSIPATATGLQLNVTALGATSGSFLTVWATGATQPTASSLNPQPGAPPIPNAVTTGVSAGGQFNIFNAAGSVNVLVDVVGYYTDHNHDDRYYTEAEVDAAVATKDDSDAAIDINTTTTAMGAGDVTLATVTLATPTSGYVVANSSVTLHGNGALSAARCSITTGTTVVDATAQQAYADSNQRQMLSGTQGFTINKGFFFGSSDTITINLVCDGVGGAPSLEDPNLTAIFTPDPDAFSTIIFVPLSESEIAPPGE